ncbi:Hypothetical glycosyl hydrolase 6 [Plantibacter flavus]|uniref:Putative glycosyl hydrolase-like family 6 (GHL6) protein n=1 Tax=Plantibacter flavus TaxID=150123 RepID=A0A3N2C2K3_9MICO|nr:alpha-amylase family protein [Plantibacter flavus]ROR81723.1 putative glycosyl hydrolase-like family 6 (GHL6) protein [Plantibacter flavus]SMG16068.1 Hypothetical glycosyl hydrolase 6 [Plantibacter flavus]
MTTTQPLTTGTDTIAWFSGDQRWTQLTFVEDDPLHFDLDAWADVMDRTASTAICISAGGYIAFYPTSIPLHYRSRHLGDRDLLGEIVDLARSRGMVVMARIDPHAVHRDVHDAHPEWIARTEDGEVQEHWAHPGTFVTDAFGDYNWEFTTEVAREVTADYDIDAVFANRWQGHGPGYTETAQRLFRAASGLALPTSRDAVDGESWQAYRGWRRERLSDLVAHWDAAVQDVKPEVRFIPNLGSFAAGELRDDVARLHVPFFLVDHQARNEGETQWAAGRDAKRTRSIHPDKPVGLITSVGPESHGYRWKDSVNAGQETVGWIVDGFVHGAFPWFTKFAARIHDTRWIPAVERAFTLHREIGATWQQARPVAEVCVWDVDNAFADARTRRAASGMYQALVELRTPFEFVGPRGLHRLGLPETRVVVLPEIDEIDERSAAALRAFVEGGGELVVTGAGPLIDGGTPLVTELTGAQLTARSAGVVRNNYVQRSSDGTLAAGLDGADRIIGGTRLARFAPSAEASVHWRFVPDHPDLPMEEVYPRSEAVDPAVFRASLVASDAGGTVPAHAGTVQVIGFNLAELYHETLLGDHLTLLGNTVEAALGGSSLVRIDGPGLLDAAVWTDGEAFMLAFANLTDPLAMRGQQRAVTELSGIRVRIDAARLSEATGRPVVPAELSAEVVLDDRRTPAPLAVVDGTIIVELPTVRELGMIRLTS